MTRRAHLEHCLREDLADLLPGEVERMTPYQYAILGAATTMRELVDELLMLGIDPHPIVRKWTLVVINMAEHELVERLEEIEDDKIQERIRAN